MVCEAIFYGASHSLRNYILRCDSSTYVDPVYILEEKNRYLTTKSLNKAYKTPHQQGVFFSHLAKNKNKGKLLIEIILEELCL